MHDFRFWMRQAADCAAMAQFEAEHFRMGEERNFLAAEQQALANAIGCASK